MIRRPRLGSLCTGYGGLDLAVGQVYDVTHAWHAENDPDASKVLAMHWPDVPNLGDLTAVDWSSVEPVDILTAGFPCQPVSSAGRRKGVNDERWLFDDIADAIGRMDPQPRLLVLENVPGLLTANRGHAMARVVQRLAALGYVGRYRIVRASDVGAPHRRERVFIVAHLADPEGIGHRDTGAQGDAGMAPAAVASAAADPDGDAVRQQPVPVVRSRGAAIPRGSGAGAGVVTLLPMPAARDWRSGESNIMDRNARPLNEVIVNLLPTPRVAATRTGRTAILGSSSAPSLDQALEIARGEMPRELNSWQEAPASWRLLPTPRATDGTKGGPNQHGSSGDLMLPAAVQPGRWGAYAPAIARWERITGRPAPDPTEPGAKGQPRLSPRFVEWLMGLPDGWVTDHLPRNAALRVLGNGVVPQQAAAAIDWLVSS